MKRQYLLLDAAMKISLVILFVIGGCSDQSDNATTPNNAVAESAAAKVDQVIDIGAVKYLNSELHVQDSTTSTEVYVQYGYCAGETYMFGTDVGRLNYDRYVAFDLRSSDGSLLWYTAFAQDEDAMYVIEASSTDSLTLTAYVEGEFWNEIYTLNEQEPLIISIPLELREKLVLREQGYEVIVSPEDSIQMAAAFERYEQYIGSASSLTNNEFGIFLAEIVVSFDISELMPVHAAAAKLFQDEGLCKWMGYCAMVKCLIPGNPICWMCGGVSLGCLLTDLWNLLFSVQHQFPTFAEESRARESIYPAPVAA